MKRLILALTFIVVVKVSFSQCVIHFSKSDTSLPATYVIYVTDKGDSIKSYLPAPPGFMHDRLTERYVRAQNIVILPIVNTSSNPGSDGDSHPPIVKKPDFGGLIVPMNWELTAMQLQFIAAAYKDLYHSHDPKVCTSCSKKKKQPWLQYTPQINRGYW